MITLDSSALVTEAALKAWLKIPASSEAQDVELGLIGNAASALIDQACGRAFRSRTHTELRNGANRLVLHSRHYPITAITSVSMRVSPLEAFEALVEDEDFAYDASAGIFERLIGRWPRGVNTVELVYTAGYSLDGANGVPMLPADLTNAVLETAKLLYDRWRTGMVSAASTSIGGRWHTRSPDLPEDVQATIKRHRKVRL